MEKHRRPKGKAPVDHPELKTSGKSKPDPEAFIFRNAVNHAGMIVRR